MKLEPTSQKPDLIERLETNQARILDLSQSPMLKIYPAAGELLSIIDELNRIAFEAVTNMDHMYSDLKGGQA